MNNQKQLRKYATRFIERLKPSIRNGYDVAARIYPANANGAIVDFEIVPAKKQKIDILPTVDTVNTSLKNIEQRLISGELDSVSFHGTNVYLEGNRILLIKGEDDHQNWSNAAVENDLSRVLNPKVENS